MEISLVAVNGAITIIVTLLSPAISFGSIPDARTSPVMVYMPSTASDGIVTLYIIVLVSPADTDNQSHCTAAGLKVAPPLLIGVTFHPSGKFSSIANPTTSCVTFTVKVTVIVSPGRAS